MPWIGINAEWRFLGINVSKASLPGLAGNKNEIKMLGKRKIKGKKRPLLFKNYNFIDFSLKFL